MYHICAILYLYTTNNAYLYTTGKYEEAMNPVKCFLQKVVNDPVLVWGGTFTRRDPVHVDDRYHVYLLNKHNYKKYRALTQASCQNSVPR